MALPYSPVLSGDVALGPNGVARCRGACTIATTPLAPGARALAFAFELCALACDCAPRVTFGVTCGGERHALDYFALLRSLRASSVDPPIPFDAVAVPVRLLARAGALALFVNDAPCPDAVALGAGALAFFVAVDAREALVLTPFLPPSPAAFFPAREARLWAEFSARVAARGAVARGAGVSAAAVLGARPLAPLPGRDFAYFEAELRALLPRAEGAVCVGVVDGGAASALVATDAGALLLSSGRRFPLPVALEAGHTVGVGVRHAALFLTYDGEPLQVQGHPECPDFKQLLAYVRLGAHSECALNFGERPFAWAGASPPPGWALLVPPRPDAELFAIGFWNEPHLLHFFGTSNHRHDQPDAHVCREEAARGIRFEVTAVCVDDDDLFGCGFVEGEFPLGNMVGWVPRTIGVHTDDGAMFRESGSGVPLIHATEHLRDGDSLGIIFNGGNIRALRNGVGTDLPGQWNRRPFPAFTTRAACITILNLGELPFYGTANAEGPRAVKLFNQCKVVLTNCGIEETGLLPGDEVEARDGAFRGTFLGEFRGLYLMQFNGIEGAVPLDLTDPLFVRKLLRVTYRPGRLLRAVLLSRSVVVCDTAPNQTNACGLYPTQNGIAICIGQSSAGYVMRPVIDLMNNDSLFTLPKLPQSIPQFFKGRQLQPTFVAPRLACLDVVTDAKSRASLMLGSHRGSDFGWNNRNCSRIGERRGLWFRVFGFGYEREGDPPHLTNVGNRIGGQLFHANCYASEGSLPPPNPEAQIAYGAVGLTPLPGVVMCLLESLNAACLESAEPFPAPPTPPLSLSDGFIYDGEEEEAPPPPSPLIVKVRG